MHHSDVIIIGGGLAGLSAALHLADRMSVTVLAKRELEVSSSQWAQGGIAAVLAEGDSFDSHVHDTVVAGAMLNDLPATRFVIEQGPAAIAWLRAQGVPFDTEHGELHLTREGGHSQRRIAHVADATGAAIQRALLARARAHERITLLENQVAVDLITARHVDDGHQDRCHGVYALDLESGKVLTFTAAHTILATGGAGKVYRYTTNPDTASGDGVAMAWRAGCRVANMEFIQFHPTCLYHPKAKNFLISEAVRGEGGVLRLPDGTRFMPAHDERAELAPRDVVARAIDFEMKRHGLDCVYLDITERGEAFIRQHFPTIHQRCLELGIDIAREPIPVVPAVHFTCGGVLTDLAGRTDLPGLYAVGEVAYTGLHGANRLASNSLLECVVFGTAAAQAIAQAPAPEPTEARPWDESRVSDADELVVISHNWDELRRMMWNYVGIVRTDKRLERAAHRIALLQSEVQEFYANFRVTRDLLELRNLLQVAELIVRSARLRHESRGLHYSADWPRTAAPAAPTILVPRTPAAAA
jgi:L-aspartate oxidase